jgi:hypothetical protein
VRSDNNNNNNNNGPAVSGSSDGGSNNNNSARAAHYSTPFIRTTPVQTVHTGSSGSTGGSAKPLDTSSTCVNKQSGRARPQLTSYHFNNSNSGRGGPAVSLVIANRRSINGDGNVDDTKVPPSEDSPSVLTSERQSALYTPELKDDKKERETRMADLKGYVRHELFSGWKFFTNRKQILYNGNKGSIVLKICNDMHVRPEARQYWWDTNKTFVVNSLNRKRSDVTTACKKTFLGK